MVNFIRRLFSKGLKNKANSSTIALETSETYACVQNMKESLQQCMYDHDYKDYRGDYHIPDDFIQKNEEILKNLIKQYSLDSAFMENIDIFLQGDIEELSKHSKTSTEYQFNDPDFEEEAPPIAFASIPKFKELPLSKTLFNRPWIVKMHTNDDGFSTLQCYAIDEDGEIIQVNGHPVPPLPGDAPKNEWKSLNQSLKLNEIPPIPKCPKHRHLQDPMQFELVRETIFQATIYNRRVNNGRASVINSETNEEEQVDIEEEELERFELPDPRRLTIRSREMQERMIRNAYFRLIGRRARAKHKKTALSVAYAQRHSSPSRRQKHHPPS